MHSKCTDERLSFDGRSHERVPRSREDVTTVALHFALLYARLQPAWHNGTLSAESAMEHLQRALDLLTRAVINGETLVNAEMLHDSACAQDGREADRASPRPHFAA
jgi:hypothetical protein